MFIEKLTKREKEKLADIAITTYNLSGYPKVPDYANIKIEDDEISINWTEESFLCGREMFSIDILDFGIFFCGLDEDERTEKKVFKFLDKKFPKYANQYYNAFKEEINENDIDSLEELKLKMKRFKKDFEEECVME